MDTETGSVDATLRLEARPPFSFEHSLAFVDGFTPCSDNRVCRDEMLVSGGYAASVPFVACVRTDPASRRDGESDALCVDVTWPAAPGDVAAVGEALRASLSLDDDLQPLYRAAAADPSFAAVVAALHGYHHVRFPTPFEAACWAALSQRTTWAVATRQKRALVEAAGHLATVDGQDVACFPTPERVLAAREAVAAAIDHARKRKTILGAAEVFAAEDLQTLPDASLADRLAEIWGFGPWSIEFVTLRGFGRLSRLPRTERRLREAVATVYDLDSEAATDAEMTRLSAPYAPQEGYWAHYIRAWAE